MVIGRRSKVAFRSENKMRFPMLQMLAAVLVVKRSQMQLTEREVVLTGVDPLMAQFFPRTQHRGWS